MAPKRPNLDTNASLSTASKRNAMINETAESLADRLEAKVTYLTMDGYSWYILKERWKTSNKQEFEQEWAHHPEKRHQLKVFGRVVNEKRWSQCWGFDYSYSGAKSIAKPLSQSEVVMNIIEKCNILTIGLIDRDVEPFNGCLQNWYENEDSIGIHADDERSMRSDCPIFSLSWGGTRRFLFRARKDKEKTELWLKDGDLLVMGGTCQLTHKHEVPPRRKTKDPPTSNRINFTIRAFKKDSL